MTYDTVRCGFVEGPPSFEGNGIRQQSHVQIADGELAPQYRDDAGPSACRPTD